MNLNNQLIQLEVKLGGRDMFAAFDTGASISVVNKNLIDANPGIFKFVKDIPAGLDANGLPLGLQVIGKPFDEETVFAVSAEIERAAQFTALPSIMARSQS